MADPFADGEPADVSDDAHDAFEDTFEGDVSRPRFTGMKRQWLNYTQEARDASISLDRIEDADLASHLYNAHRLKRRRLAYDVPPLHVQSHLRKERWGSELAEGIGVVPKHSWTAWPLEPDRLPSRETAGNIRLKTNTEPLLHGEFGTDQKPSMDLEDCLLSEILRQARKSFYARQAQAQIRTGDKDKGQADDGTVEPAVMVDEGQARTLSHPAIRHIIAQLERLLQALHVSRKGHIRLRETGGSDEDDTSGGETSRSRSRSRSRSISRNRSSSAARIRAAPRDWSEALGIAAMIGWKPEALRTTYLRCAELFDESMDFTSLTAASLNGIMHLDMSKSIRTSEQSEANQTSATRAAALVELCCPYEDCSRHYAPYPIRWRLTEHLKRKHGERSESKGRQSVLPEDEIYGGVHLDGFLQPIDLPRRPTRRRKSVTSSPTPTTSSSEWSERPATGSDSGTQSSARVARSSDGSRSDTTSPSSEEDEASDRSVTDTVSDQDYSSAGTRSAA